MLTEMSPRPLELRASARDDWRQRCVSPRFVDVVDGAPGVYSTHASFGWSRTDLKVMFDCEEPVCAPRTEKANDVDWEASYVELYVDGGDCYYSLTTDQHGVTSETLFVWRDAYDTDGRFTTPEFDLVAADALVFEGDLDRSALNYFTRRGAHPRGYRWAFRHWTLTGLRTRASAAVASAPVNRRWLTEVELPWAALNRLRGCEHEPRVGDVWRIHVGRHTPLLINGAVVHQFSAASSFGTLDRHHPERFVAVQLDGPSPFADGAP
jgi:hypothetical protein